MRAYDVALRLVPITALCLMLGCDRGEDGDNPSPNHTSPPAALNACSSTLSNERWNGAEAHEFVSLDFAKVEGFELVDSSSSASTASYRWERTVNVEGKDVLLKLAVQYANGLPDNVIDDHFTLKENNTITLYDPIDVGGQQLPYSVATSRTVGSSIKYSFAPRLTDGSRQLVMISFLWDEHDNQTCREASRQLGDELVKTVRLVNR